MERNVLVPPVVRRLSEDPKPQDRPHRDGKPVSHTPAREGQGHPPDGESQNRRRVVSAIAEHGVRPVPRSPAFAVQRGNRVQRQRLRSNGSIGSDPARTRPHRRGTLARWVTPDRVISFMTTNNDQRDARQPGLRLTPLQRVNVDRRANIGFDRPSLDPDGFSN
jgi:hypothetical protein